jgi:hypothetical protein
LVSDKGSEMKRKMNMDDDISKKCEDLVLDWKDEHYLCPLTEILGILALSKMIVDYLPTVHVEPLRKRDATSRYFITIDLSKKIDDQEFSNRWMMTLDIECNHLYWLFYHSNPTRTFILLNAGSKFETQKYPTEKGLLQSSKCPKDDATENTMSILKSLICTSDDLLNVAITELSDQDFAHQWIHYVGCHGYRWYPIWIWNHESQNVTTEEEASFETYINKYWEERKKHGCRASEETLCQNRRGVCWQDAPHHFCRETNQSACQYLRECLCGCKNCENDKRINTNQQQQHQCLTPDQWFCFSNWNPPQN